MKYGLIGKNLAHSFSKDIHNMIGDYEYELCEMEENELEEFFSKRNFKAVNVTIPYKETVIPYLDFISKEAKEIGAVNTVVNKCGKLYGYNTDFKGLSALIDKLHINIKGKKTVILGTGGTSKTAVAVARSLGANPIIVVSRAKKENTITYEELIRLHKDTEILINTTPVGMYPDNNSSILDISDLTSLEGVIDVIYNPLRTNLVIDAKERGIKAEGGLYMLVAQAIYASEYFLDTHYPLEKLKKIFRKIERKKENIVLIGMPASGKTTVSKIISKEISRSVSDTDHMIKDLANKPISQIFEEDGETAFRDRETDVIANISLLNNAIISTGGGIVLRDINIKMLKQNGIIYFIDRPCEQLLPSKFRPLAQDEESIRKLYSERYELYRKAADVVVDAADSPVSTAKKIIGDFYK